jgi:uncharacterized protein
VDVITLDTSGIVALFVRKDQRYREAVRALEAARMPTVVPVAFLETLQTGETLLDHGDLDLPRITTLMTRYAALPLGFADAAVVACAERNGGIVLTFDRDGLQAISRDLPITLIP